MKTPKKKQGKVATKPASEKKLKSTKAAIEAKPEVIPPNPGLEETSKDESWEVVTTKAKRSHPSSAAPGSTKQQQKKNETENSVTTSMMETLQDEKPVSVLERPKDCYNNIVATPSVGLQNLGNTCYMNSALQSLMQLKPLTDYLVNRFDPSQINTTNTVSTNGALIKVFKELVEQVLSSNSTVSPESFHKTLGKFNSRFANYDQNDSQIAIMVTLNLMHEDINKVTDKPYQAYPPDSKVLGVTEAARQTWEMYESREQSPIVDILHGMYQAERICQRCNNYYYKFDTFSSLPIEIKKPGGKPSTGFISLEDCLEADREPTIINEFYCRTCQDFVDAKSTLELYQLPPILVLQFKRFRENQWGGFEKVRFPVSYPLEIDMAKYWCAENKPLNMMYRLAAVIIHEGSLNAGHYYAYGRNQGNWKMFNDSWVTELSGDGMINKDAYILFYERI